MISISIYVQRFTRFQNQMISSFSTFHWWRWFKDMQKQLHSTPISRLLFLFHSFYLHEAFLKIITNKFAFVVVSLEISVQKTKYYKICIHVCTKRILVAIKSKSVYLYLNSPKDFWKDLFHSVKLAPIYERKKTLSFSGA